jgi:hypothetical protein
MLASCGTASERHQPAAPEDIHVELFNAASERAVDMTSPLGWVVSVWDDGKITHTGDSLLWTGMAMGVLDCARGDVVERALLTMLLENGGRVYRHPSEAGREPSLDGHLGLYWGISERVRRCPYALPTWQAAIAQHEPTGLPLPFDDVLDSLRYQLGLDSKPGVEALQVAVYSWAYAVVAKKAAGYRIHLGLLTYEILESTGVGVSDHARDTFCSAAKPAGMTTVEHYCGRGDLKGWADGFTFNAYEYAHQRARWESQDGKPGLATPAIDLLVALRKLYTLP